MRSLESPLSRSVGLALVIQGVFRQLSPIVITVVELAGECGKVNGHIGRARLLLFWNQAGNPVGS